MPCLLALLPIIIPATTIASGPETSSVCASAYPPIASAIVSITSTCGLQSGRSSWLLAFHFCKMVYNVWRFTYRFDQSNQQKSRYSLVQERFKQPSQPQTPNAACHAKDKFCHS